MCHWIFKKRHQHKIIHILNHLTDPTGDVVTLLFHRELVVDSGLSAETHNVKKNKISVPLGTRSPEVERRWGNIVPLPLFPVSFFFFFLTAAPAAYRSSQARVRTGAAAASLHHSHGNTRPEPLL